MIPAPVKTISYFLSFVLILTVVPACKVDVPESGFDSYKDTTSPTVVSVSPADGSTGVDLNPDGFVSITFSEEMDESSLNSVTFGISDENTDLSGTYDCFETTCTFSSSDILHYSETYTVTLSTGIKDAGGVDLDQAYTWSFETNSLAASVSPTDGSTDVAPIPTEFVSVTFPAQMDESSLTTQTFTINDGDNDLSGTYSCAGSTCSFTSTDSLHYNDTYTVSLSPDIKDAAGSEFNQAYTWSFNTGSFISSTIPADGSTDVPIESIEITINAFEVVNSTTATTANISLMEGENTISGSVSSNDNVITFAPSTTLKTNSLHTVTISADVTDINNSRMVQDYSWSFTTGGAFTATAGTLQTAKNLSRSMVLSTNLNNTSGISYSITAGPSHGSASISGDSVLYSPSADYTGSDQFSYQANNGVEDSTSASITVTVNPWLPDTGQTTLFSGNNDVTGEDGDYNFNSPSYTDNSNGTVTDNITGLIWQQSDDDTTRNWSDAVEYCDNLSLGSTGGWRLPTVDELDGILILEVDKDEPTINTVFSGTELLKYWTSTTHAVISGSAWVVEFKVGTVNYEDKTNSHYTRCVRSGN